MWRRFRLAFALLGLTVVAAALLAFYLAGARAALSAVAGGAISGVAGGLFAWLLGGRRNRSTGDALRAALRVESVKILLVVVLLWLALTRLPQVVPAALVGTFCVGLAAFSILMLLCAAGTGGAGNEGAASTDT